MAYEVQVFEDGMVLTAKHLENIQEELIRLGGRTARIATISLPASAWTGSGTLHSQIVNIEGVTASDQVDLTPSIEQLVLFHGKDLCLVAVNDGGVVTVYAIGDKPSMDYVMQVTITGVGV